MRVTCPHCGERDRREFTVQGDDTALRRPAGAQPALVVDGQDIDTDVQAELTKSFASSEATAQQYPNYADQIIAAAKASFLDGDDWAYTAGLVAIVLGAMLVFFMFPRKDAEQELLRRYHAEDTASA